MSKRISMDHSQIINEGAALREDAARRNSAGFPAAFSAALDDADEAPLAPRGANTSSFSKASQKSFPSTSSLSDRIPNDDRNLEKTLSNIKTMSLMFESGALPLTTRPNSIGNVDAAKKIASQHVEVPEAPPPLNATVAQRDRSLHDNYVTRNSDDQFPVHANRSLMVAENSYVRSLEHRVEQLEAMLEDMQQRLGSVLASQEFARIPSKHDPAPNQLVQLPSKSTSQNMKNQRDETASDSRGQNVSGTIAMGDQLEPNSDTSGNHSAGRRHSIYAAAKGLIFVRRVHLPAIGHIPTFDKATCSEGIVLHNMNSVATLLRFSNTPHPYCLGPIITRGSPMLCMALYFGEPALPAISESFSAADLKKKIESGASKDDIIHAIISSPPDALPQALKLLDEAALSSISKKFGIAIRTDRNFQLRCEDLRRSCREIATDAANVGVCYFGVCGASVPSHGIRGDEMVWCSSINERKEPGALKMKPLIGKDEKIAALKAHIKLLLSDMASICDAVPGFSDFLSDFIPRRRTEFEDHSHLQWSKLWDDVSGQKQIFDMMLGPRAIPKVFATWREDLMNIFVLRGKKTENSDLEQNLVEVLDQQENLAVELERLPMNLRKAKLITRLDEAGQPVIPFLPVISSISIIPVPFQMNLLHPLKVLLERPDEESQPPLMTERGFLNLTYDNESRPGSAFNSRHSSSQQMTPRDSIVDLSIYQGSAALVQFTMRTKDEIFDLCGIGSQPKQGEEKSDKNNDDFIPVHPSIGTARPNTLYSDSNTGKAKKIILKMHPVLKFTDLSKKFDEMNLGNVEGLKSFIEGTLNQLRSALKDISELSEQPGQLFLEKDIFYMENFMLELNSTYLPPSNSLELNPEKIQSTISVSLTKDVQDRSGRVVLASNQFYNIRLIGENAFKLFAENGSYVSNLIDIPRDQAAKMGFTIASIKRPPPMGLTEPAKLKTNMSFTKMGKTQEVPSMVIPWMPGKMDQFAEKSHHGCSTFGPGSIVTIKLDAPRKRLWLINGVSGSGNIQGIPDEKDIFSRMFNIDFSVVRPFVAFSSKFQNVQLMPELPAVVVDIYKKTLALEGRLDELTSEFSQLGGADSLIIYGFSSNFLELNKTAAAKPNFALVQRKLEKRFEAYPGISNRGLVDSLNFKIFNLFIKRTGSVEQPEFDAYFLQQSLQVCKVEFVSEDAMRNAKKNQIEDPRFQVQGRDNVELEDLQRDADSAHIDYYISEEIEQSRILVFRATGNVPDPSLLLQNYCKMFRLKYEPMDDFAATDPNKKSYKVYFENLSSADQAKEEFEDFASSDDEKPLYKAFTVHNYEYTATEVAATARNSWFKFKRSSKQLLLAYKLLQEHYSDCMSATHYDTVFAPILDRAKKFLGFSFDVVEGLCEHIHDLHEE